jgi:RNA polymerase sigma-70 factor (ECF subfamily)
MDLKLIARHHGQRESNGDRTLICQSFSRIQYDTRFRPTAVPETLTTQVLIEMVQQGDRNALDELCNRYLMRVLAAVRIRLGANLRTKLESWDIVQEVMMDALRKVESFDFRTEGAFLKYLNKVVENRIRDEADRWATQRRNRNREVSIDGARSPDASNPLDLPEGHGALTPSKIVSLQEDLARLELAIDCLGEKSEDYRELIVAVKIEGRTYREIADETGSTEDAVRMRVKRAMAALANLYNELDEGA